MKRFVKKMMIFILCAFCFLLFYTHTYIKNDSVTLKAKLHVNAPVTLKNNALYKLQYNDNAMDKSPTTQSQYSLETFHQPSINLSSNITERLKVLQPFQVQVTLKERAMMYDLLNVFDKVLTENQISYTLYSGTLLGSFRHHDIVPWDDDLDVMVNVSARPFMQQLFKHLQPKYTLVEVGPHDKLYRYDGVKSSRYHWLWPYVDISYYNENMTHIWDIANPYGKTFVVPKSIMFPTHRRPLYNISLPAPRDTFAALLWDYGWNSTCEVLGYSHSVEGRGPLDTRSCEDLADKFGFVDHLPSSSGVLEILRFKGQNVTHIIVPEPEYAISEQFVIRLKTGFTPPVNVDIPKT